MQHVLDYGWGRPDPKHIWEKHYLGVLRYLGESPNSKGKKMDEGELKSLLNAGLQVGLIWQETDPAMTGGKSSGRDESKRAQEAARALGVPTGSAIYFTADHRTVTADHAVSYLDGVQENLTDYKIGLYGSFYVIEGVREKRPNLVQYYWQTLAWSDGKVTDGLHLYQGCFGLYTKGQDGEDVEIDVNDVLQEDWGQFNEVES